MNSNVSDPIAAVKAAGDRPAEYQDVLNALKAMNHDLRMFVAVMNATIDFLTIKMREENENSNPT